MSILEMVDSYVLRRDCGSDIVEAILAGDEFALGSLCALVAQNASCDTNEATEPHQQLATGPWTLASNPPESGTLCLVRSKRGSVALAVWSVDCWSLRNMQYWRNTVHEYAIIWGAK